jgi:hypothetical protein
MPIDASSNPYGGGGLDPTDDLANAGKGASVDHLPPEHADVKGGVEDDLKDAGHGAAHPNTADGGDVLHKGDVGGADKGAFHDAGHEVGDAHDKSIHFDVGAGHDHDVLGHDAAHDDIGKGAIHDDALHGVDHHDDGLKHGLDDDPGHHDAHSTVHDVHDVHDKGDISDLFHH